MDYFCRKPTKLDNELYLKVLVTSSLCLQILLYFVAPWRKRSTSKYMKGLISTIFSLSNWVPAVTLILITSCIVYSYGRSTARSESPLLTWAALMLLHLAGHGQEREFPLSLQLEEIGNEAFRLVLEFLFFSMIFSIAFLFNFESWDDESLPETLGFALLACFKTYGKLKNLWDRSNEIKHESGKTSFPSHPGETGQVMDMNKETATLLASYFFERSRRLIMGHSIKNDNLDNTPQPTYRELKPMKAIETVEAEQKLIYYKFYRGVVPSKFELLIVTVLVSVELSSSPLFIATIFVNSYVILYAILFIMSKIYVPVFKVIKETEIPLLSTALLILPPLTKTLYTSSLESSNMLMYILLITHHLVVYPIMLKTHYFHRVYRNDPHQWPKWSRIIPKFNVITYRLRKGYKMPTSIHHMLNTWPLTGEEQYMDSVGKFIFNELKEIKLCRPSDHPLLKENNVTRKVTATKGPRVLKKACNQDSEDCKVPFGEEVLLWHVTTKIMYHTSSTNTPTFHSNMSILLSDYMGYLLIVQPWIMSKQRGAVLPKCLEMWAEIDKLAKDSNIQDDERVCKEILNQQNSGEEKAQTLLQEANDLAKKLKSTFPDEDQRWSFIVREWVRKLAYASTHCHTIDHIQGLSQGGELVSIVWLWMLHFNSMPESTPTIKNSNPAPSMKGTNAMKKSRPRRKKISKTPKALRKKQFYPSVLFSECYSFFKRQLSLENITFIFAHLLLYFIIYIILHGPTPTFLIFIFSYTPIVLISVDQPDALKNKVNKILYFMQGKSS